MEPFASRRSRDAWPSRRARLDCSAAQLASLAAESPDLAMLDRPGAPPRCARHGLTTSTIAWLLRTGCSRASMPICAGSSMPARTLLPATARRLPGDAARNHPTRRPCCTCAATSRCLDEPQLAMVGSRNPTAGGRATAREFAACFARAGLTITSGLALGIDAACHEGALAGGGHTIAVLGCGLDADLSARRHEALAERIAAQRRAGIRVSARHSRRCRHAFPATQSHHRRPCRTAPWWSKRRSDPAR